MNILKTVNHKESQEIFSKENQKSPALKKKRRSSSSSNVDSDVSHKRPKISKVVGNSLKRKNLQKPRKKSKSSESEILLKTTDFEKEARRILEGTLIINSKNQQPISNHVDTKVQSKEGNRKGENVKNQIEEHLYIPNSFHLEEKDKVSVEIPVEALENISHEVLVKLHLSHRYDKKYSNLKHHLWALDYETEQKTSSGRIKCEFTNLTKTKVKIPRNMRIGRANFSILSNIHLEESINDNKYIQILTDKTGNILLNPMQKEIKKPTTKTKTNTLVHISQPDKLKNLNYLQEEQNKKPSNKRMKIQSVEEDGDDNCKLESPMINALVSNKSIASRSDSTSTPNVFIPSFEKNKFDSTKFSSLDMLPQFTEFANMFCDFKKSKNEVIDAVRCDDCVIDCETIGFADSDDMFDIMKKSWSNSYTEEDWLRLLSDKFSLIGSGLINNIGDIIQTYMYSVGKHFEEKENGQETHKIEEEPGKKDTNHIQQSEKSGQNKQQGVEERKSSGRNTFFEECEKEAKILEKASLHLYAVAIETDVVHPIDDTSCETNTFSEENISSCGRQEKKNINFKNKVPKNISQTSNKIIKEQVDGNEVKRNFIQNHYVDLEKLKHETFDNDDKWIKEPTTMVNGEGTVVEVDVGGVGLIECDQDYVIFATGDKQIEIGKIVHFDAIIGKEEEFKDIFLPEKDIKLWATDVWDFNKPRKRAIDGSNDVEVKFMNLLSHTLEYKMNKEASFLSDSYSLEQNETEPEIISRPNFTEKNPNCPHFQDPGPFCKDTQNCQKNCGSMHNIPEDVNVMLGKEIGSFCDDFANYDCNMGSRCMMRHVKFSDLVSTALKGMQTRRSHCHKCNVSSRRTTPCQLLDVSYENTNKLCRYEASRPGGCTNTFCNFYHRFPGHMDLKYCKAHLHGNCTRASCYAPHISFSKLEVKFNQLLRSLERNCKKCDALNIDSLHSETRSRYDRMSITVDCLTKDDEETLQEETTREVELVSSKPVARRITMARFKDIEWRHPSTESQDSWTKDFTELETKIRRNKGNDYRSYSKNTDHEIRREIPERTYYSQRRRVHERRSPSYETVTRSRSRSPMILSRSVTPARKKDPLNERHVTFQASDCEESKIPFEDGRLYTTQRRKGDICEFFLKGKCAYGDKCYKIHQVPEKKREVKWIEEETHSAGVGKDQDLRQKLSVFRQGQVNVRLSEV